MRSIIRIPTLRCLFLFILINSLSGCKRNDIASNNTDAYISQCDTIASLDELNIFEPEIVGVNDSIVVLSTEYILYSYNIYDGKLNELIKVGDGPCDVVDFTSIGLSEDNGIWVYDGNVGKSVTVDLDKYSKEVLMIPKLRMLNDLQPIASNRFIGVPYCKSVGYCLFDSVGNTIDSLAYFPPKPKNVTDWTHSIACSGHISILSDGHHFARSVAKDGGIDFFEFKDDRISNVARYVEFDMEYSADSDAIPITTDKSLCGYYSLANQDEGYLALFSAKPIHDNPDFASTEIHTFSKDGILEKKIKLDFPLSSIAFDSKDNQIVGVSALSDDSDTQYLIKFSIPQ